MIKLSNIYEFLNEIEEIRKEPMPLGLKEIFKSAPQQAKIPTELLQWVRQSYTEGQEFGYADNTIECIKRTIAVHNYYSPLQIQSAIDRVKMELQNQPAKIITKKLYN